MNVYCPKCRKLLFKAEFGDVEIKCGSCKRIVHLRFWTAKSLMLTKTEQTANVTIKEINESKEAPNKE